MENDLISRKSLMEKIDHWASQVKGSIHHTDRIVWDVLEGVTDTICDEEAVEAEPKWISVKDGLPEKNGYYLCWVETSLMGERKKYEHRKLYWEENVWLLSAKSFKTEHPLYWMPLPEPPKEDEV